MNFLQKVAAHKHKELVSAKRRKPLARLKRGLHKSKRGFRASLNRARSRPAIIAEVKRASPSKGKLRSAVSGAELAAVYSQYADAISVVVDKRFFNGSYSLLAAVSKRARVPVLAKDFIIDEYQIYNARRHGADAVLLIAALLDAKQLASFIRTARKLGMDAVVEVHNEAELKGVLKTKASIIGINNRSLRTLKVNMNTTARLARKIPRSKRKKLVVISESGFSARADVERVAGCADAALIGTALMRSQRIASTLKELSGKPLLKVCGITSLGDARAAVAAGADLLGFNFFPGSPRCVSPKQASAIIKKIPDSVHAVGVFVNEKKSNIKKLIRFCRLDIVQLHGDEKPPACKGFGVPVIKAFRIGHGHGLGQINKYKTDFILLDTRVSGAHGGTGRALPKAVLKGAAKLRGKRRVFLAGGLAVRNVRRAAALAKPYAVDVCSGVERKKGKKDSGKMKKFAGMLYGA